MTPEQTDAFLHPTGDDVALAILTQMGMDTATSATQNAHDLYNNLCDRMTERAAFDLTERAVKSVQKMVKGYRHEDKNA